MPTNQQLQEERTNDPNNLGYSGLTDKQFVDKINSKSGNGSGTINRIRISKNHLLNGVAPGLPFILQGGASLVGKYDFLLKFLSAFSDPLEASNPTLQAFLYGMGENGDNILNAQQIAGILTTTGSRAEVLWGEGIIITETQAGDARNGVIS